MVDSLQIPQRLSFVTLGTRNMRRARAFYAAWGWREREGGTGEFAQFQLGTVRLALYPLELLGAEAAPGCPAPAPGWNGVTLAVKRMSRVPWNFGGGPTVSGDVHEVILHEGSDSFGDLALECGA
jgi:catechol 2,3-dioxygenase-like lactoylglutathione lyase family enzyme